MQMESHTIVGWDQRENGSGHSVLRLVNSARAVVEVLPLVSFSPVLSVLAQRVVLKELSCLVLPGEQDLERHSEMDLWQSLHLWNLTSLEWQVEQKHFLHQLLVTRLLGHLLRPPAASLVVVSDSVAQRPPLSLLGMVRLLFPCRLCFAVLPCGLGRHHHLKGSEKVFGSDPRGLT